MDGRVASPSAGGTSRAHAASERIRARASVRPPWSRVKSSACSRNKSSREVMAGPPGRPGVQGVAPLHARRGRERRSQPPMTAERLVHRPVAVQPQAAGPPSATSNPARVGTTAKDRTSAGRSRTSRVSSSQRTASRASSADASSMKAVTWPSGAWSRHARSSARRGRAREARPGPVGEHAVPVPQRLGEPHGVDVRWRSPAAAFGTVGRCVSGTAQRRHQPEPARDDAPRRPGPGAPPVSRRHRRRGRRFAPVRLRAEIGLGPTDPSPCGVTMRAGAAAASGAPSAAPDPAATPQGGRAARKGGVSGRVRSVRPNRRCRPRVPCRRHGRRPGPGAAPAAAPRRTTGTAARSAPERTGSH